MASYTVEARLILQAASVEEAENTVLNVLSQHLELSDVPDVTAEPDDTTIGAELDTDDTPLTICLCRVSPGDTPICPIHW